MPRRLKKIVSSVVCLRDFFFFYYLSCPAVKQATLASECLFVSGRLCFVKTSLLSSYLVEPILYYNEYYSCIVPGPHKRRELRKAQTTKKKNNQKETSAPTNLETKPTKYVAINQFCIQGPTIIQRQPRFIYCESGFSFHRNNLLRKTTAESSAQFLHPLSSPHFTQEKICKTRCLDRIPSAMKTRSARRMMKT